MTLLGKTYVTQVRVIIKANIMKDFTSSKPLKK